MKDQEIYRKIADERFKELQACPWWRFAKRSMLRDLWLSALSHLNDYTY